MIFVWFFSVNADAATIDERTRPVPVPAPAPAPAGDEKKDEEEKVGLALPILGLGVLNQRIGLHKGMKRYKFDAMCNSHWCLWQWNDSNDGLFACFFFHSIAARLLPIGVGLHTLTNPGLSPITNPALNPILHPALIPVQARIAALRARVAALVSLF